MLAEDRHYGTETISRVSDIPTLVIRGKGMYSLLLAALRMHKAIIPKYLFLSLLSLTNVMKPAGLEYNT